MLKILLNAEPFGFGPAAAIANIFDLIKDKGYIIDYIGEGHTNDLQLKLNYNKIINISQFDSVINDYDYFITAMDFKLAEKAIKRNIKTIFYDALTWFWKDIKLKPYAYISQDFVGVETNFNVIECNNKYIINPLLSKHTKQSEKYNVLNFGGLENCYFNDKDTITYIQNIIEPILNHCNIDYILGSVKHVKKLKDRYNIQTLPYEEMQVLLSNTNNLFCTTGLGNIYEANKYKLNTIFLPPTNDSQGQQLEIIKDKILIENNLDWSLFSNTVNYFASQGEVMNAIKNNIHSFDKILFLEALNKIEFSKLNLNFNNRLNLEDILVKIII